MKVAAYNEKVENKLNGKDGIKAQREKIENKAVAAQNGQAYTDYKNDVRQISKHLILN